MANYVVTTNGLDKIDINLKATDKLFIFYKNSDSVRMDLVVKIGEIKAQKEFMVYNTKDELMIGFGFLVAKSSGIIVLDQTIPVPEMLRDKIKTIDKETTNTQKRKTSKRNKKENEKEITKVDTPISDDSANVTTNKIEEKPKKRAKKAPKEDSNKVGIIDSVPGKMDSDRKKKVERLKELLGITAEDIKYSFGTDFMMGRVITFVSESKTDDELRSSLEYNFRTDKEHLVAKTVMANINAVKKIVNSAA